MRKILFASITVLLVGSTTANSACYAVGRIQKAHVEANSESPVLDASVVVEDGAEVLPHFETKGWTYIDVRERIVNKDTTVNSSGNWTGIWTWVQVHVGWVRSKQVQCME